MSLRRFTVLDCVVVLAVGGIVAVVVYRYRVQQHFELYGLLVMAMMVAGYLSYRRSPVQKKEDGPECEGPILNKKEANQKE